jgi:hypothetical protein
MIETNKQKQTTGDNSTAIQAQTVTIIQNVDRDYIEEVARDVLKRDFDTLTKSALVEFKNRTEDLVSTFIDNIAENKKFDIKKIEKPDFQFALRDAQIEYGKTGSAELKESLVNLLTKIGEEKHDDIARLYSEAIKTLPILNKEQIKTIAIVCWCRYLSFPGGNLDSFLERFQKKVFPFIEGAGKSHYAFSNIEYAKCGQVNISKVMFWDLVRSNYQGIFAKGFDQGEIITDIPAEHLSKLFIKCLLDPSKVQINAMNEHSLDKKVIDFGLNEAQSKRVKELFQIQSMSTDEISNLLIEKDINFKKLADYINNTQAGNLTLTSVGLIIGVVNIEAISGEIVDLNSWLLES